MLYERQIYTAETTEEAPTLHYEYPKGDSGLPDLRWK